jgi:hypothetical protein
MKKKTERKIKMMDLKDSDKLSSMAKKEELLVHLHSVLSALMMKINTKKIVTFIGAASMAKKEKEPNVMLAAIISTLTEMELKGQGDKEYLECLLRAGMMELISSCFPEQIAKKIINLIETANPSEMTSQQSSCPTSIH